MVKIFAAESKMRNPAVPSIRHSILNRGKNLLHEEITSEIIAAYYAVYNTLGYGFLEKIYENALILELQKRGLTVKQQVPIKVYYEAKIVGGYFADLLVNEVVVVELKAIEQILEAHEDQVVNYLKATNIEIELLLNFGPKAEFKRKIFSNTRKPAQKGHEPGISGP